MSDIDHAQLRRLDLTLLLVFDAVLASGKLTTVAKQLGLTQSAISHAVARLREIFGDPLFVRRPHGVLPTPRALALRAPLSEALALIAGALRPAPFDPARSERIFRIAATDHVASVFGPRLVAEPGPRIIFRNLIRDQAIQAVQTGEADLALGLFASRTGAHELSHLYRETYSVVGRARHPAFRRHLTLDAYLRYEHVLASPGGTIDGIVDSALAKYGLKRSVRLALPYFLASLAATARTDLLATIPSRLAALYAPSFGLALAPPPLQIRAFPVSMLWSKRTGGDPAVLWLRAQIESAARADQNPNM